MKTLWLSLSLALPGLLTGCGRAVTESDVMGTWEYTEANHTQIYTLSTNHAFTSEIVSKKDLRHFGDWSLNGKYLVLSIYSNSWTAPVTSHKTNLIVRFSDSQMILRSTVEDATNRTYFRRSMGP